MYIKIKNVNPVGIKDGSFNTILTKYKSDEKGLLDEFLNENMPKINIKKEDYEVVLEEINLNYDNFSYAEIVKKILPGELDSVPSSFEIIGRIAHLNLREKFLPYKNLIGQLILDVNN